MKAPSMIGIFLIRHLIPLLERLILWLFGWRRLNKLHKLHNIIICRYIVYQDPIDASNYVSKSRAIGICKERFKSYEE